MATEEGSKLDSTLAIRIKDSAGDEFKRKCSVLGREYSEVMRELIDAFNDDRLTIQKSAEQIKQEELYS